MPRTRRNVQPRSNVPVASSKLSKVCGLCSFTIVRANAPSQRSTFETHTSVVLASKRVVVRARAVPRAHRRARTSRPWRRGAASCSRPSRAATRWPRARRPGTRRKACGSAIAPWRRSSSVRPTRRRATGLRELTPPRFRAGAAAASTVRPTRRGDAASSTSRESSPRRRRDPRRHRRASPRPASSRRAPQVKPPSPLWIFGYGSLCWKPEFPHDEQIVGRITGWTRRFAQRSADHRGTPEAPGLVATGAETKLHNAQPGACRVVGYRTGRDDHLRRRSRTAGPARAGRRGVDVRGRRVRPTERLPVGPIFQEDDASSST